MGYGDLFVAALLGGVYSDRPRVQRLSAALTLAIAGVFDLLFLVVDNLPATVPVALALLLVELRLVGRRRTADEQKGGRRSVSGRYGPSTPEDAIPPPAM
jgi:hypothetical protein